MLEGPSSALSAWSNFYVIAGSSAGALTGLMFVVMTLVAGVWARRSQAISEGIATFNTPSVVHFCAALLVSMVLSAPWHSLIPVSIMLGLTGLYGVVSTLLVMRRVRGLSEYRPGFDDWLWHAILPFCVYVAIVAAAIRLPAVPTEPLFAIAAGTVLLIFIGIHNAWDVVTYISIEQGRKDDENR
jgi:hypothetical protein